MEAGPLCPSSPALPEASRCPQNHRTLQGWKLLLRTHGPQGTRAPGQGEIACGASQAHAIDQFGHSPDFLQPSYGDTLARFYYQLTTFLEHTTSHRLVDPTNVDIMSHHHLPTRALDPLQ